MNTALNLNPARQRIFQRIFQTLPPVLIVPILLSLLGISHSHAQTTCTIKSDSSARGRMVMHNNSTRQINYLYVQPGETGSGVTCSSQPLDRHYIAYPADSNQWSKRLLVFLGGSGSFPSNYTDIADQAAWAGYGVINLSYPNNKAAGEVCGSLLQGTLETNINSCADPAHQQMPNGVSLCYTNFRSEIVFGQNTSYLLNQANANGHDNLNCYALDKPTGSGGSSTVDKYNSVINRVVAVLQYLSNPNNSKIPDVQKAYWKSFLLSHPSSPYQNGQYPDWRVVTLAGHSQGGGHAAFVAMNLPTQLTAPDGSSLSSQPARVALFSAPQDKHCVPYASATAGPDAGKAATPCSDQSADWVLSPSATPVDRFWGLRNGSSNGEGSLGDFVSSNWLNLGGAGYGGVGGPSYGVEFVLASSGGQPDDGTCLASVPGSCDQPWVGQQRFVSLLPNSSLSLTNHNSTAVNGAYLPGAANVWQLMFTQGLSSN